MNLTAGDLLQSFQALLGFSIFFIPPGYLLASLTQIANFRTLSLPERLLWSLSLSTPLAILLSVMLGRHFFPGLCNTVVYLCGTAFVILLIAQAIRGRLSNACEWDRPTVLCVFLMAGLAIYVLLATVGIQVDHRLFESVASGDWSVRVPLVSAAIHGSVPPLNPFYGINGQAFELRYYYYWYVLCGQAGRMLHSTPRAVLTASAAWSGLALFSILFLFFKYLFRPDSSESGTTIRRLCLLSIPVSCILGLDIIPSIIGTFMHPVKVFPEMEWWRWAGDFSMSFHTAILYAPHHTAGLVCCMTGFLLLTLCVVSTGTLPCTLQRRLFYGVLAGVCFAAAAGSSTYVTFFFVLACTLFAVDRAFARDWHTVAAIALCGMVAFCVSWGFLHELMHNAGTSAQTKQGSRFLAFYPRDWRLAYVTLHMQWGATKHLVSRPHWLDILFRVPIWIMLFVIELGFFGFVLAYRLHAHWPRRKQLSDRERLQWILCGSFAFCGLFITSAAVIGVNDLGRHAGFALRFVAILWATPLIARWLWSSQPWPLLQHTWLRRTILATIILGISAQLWQVVLQRTYFMLVDSGHLVARPPFPSFRNIGFRYFETRKAFDALDRTLPADASIQFNPRSSYWALMTIYLNHRVAAGDRDCMTAFGGDEVACSVAMPAIQALFGGSHFRDNNIAFDPQGVTQQAFIQICAQHHLAAVIATASDRVWPEKTSWVWTEPVLYADSSIRVLTCPKIN